MHLDEGNTASQNQLMNIYYKNYVDYTHLQGTVSHLRQDVAEDGLFQHLKVGLPHGVGARHNEDQVQLGPCASPPVSK